MNNAIFFKREIRVYIFLTSLVICGLVSALITAPKIVHLGINFPFGTIVFSILTYPIVDCICELWGKQVARQTLWIGLISQVLIACIIQLSVMAPYSSFWHLQPEYQAILSTGVHVVVASLLAFTVSQMLDIVVYQKIKEISAGKYLWLRSNISTYLGQIIDSIIFINIVFSNSNQKWNILFGAITIKIILSFLMTPVVYLIVFAVNKFLDFNTLAFKAEDKTLTTAC
jgi:hypothetical protein